MNNQENFEKAKLLFQEGLNYLLKEQYENAELNFLKSLKLLPDRLSTIQNLISIYIATEQKKKLKETLDNYKHLNKENKILYGIAYDYFFDKNFSKSIEICKNLLKIKEFKDSITDLLASNFKEQKLFLDALKIYRKKIKEKKDYLIYYNIGCLFFDLGRIHKAQYYFKKSKKLKNIDNSNLWNLSLCYLTFGDLDHGFSLYEYRWLKKNNSLIKKFKDIKIPLSTEEIKNKKILISDEQGLGDTIQFSRFIIELLNFTQKITFVVNSKLTKLLSNLNKNITTLDYKNLDTKNFDYHISLCSLPKFLNIKYLDDIKYYQLNIDSKNFIKNKDKINIGLSWSGNPNFHLDEYRSTSFQNFKELLRFKKVNFYKLSQTIRNEEFLEYSSISNLTDLSNKSIFEISEIIKELDLVVSTDTSIIHLAGILNIKSILLLNYNSDWRWFRDKNKTIWYPSVEIIKQEKFNSWDSVFKELKNKIEKLVDE